MAYQIIPLQRFLKDLKTLAKTHRSVVNDLNDLAQSLKSEPNQGVPLGNNCYKIRMTITSKGKGKSGGARVITCVKVIRETVYLLALFDKSDIDNIDDEELQNRINQIPED
jgi:mRNA-degrading endonuclease RelE of RelBE toxin-antitoxin system